jgi:hypothetical protein
MADAPEQRDPDVVAYESFSGLRNDVTPERFSAADLAVANNIDIDRTGRLARRLGYAPAGDITGPAHSVWCDRQGDAAYFAQGAVLKQLNADLSATTLKTLAVASPISFTKVNDRVYYSNGVDTGVIGQGAVRSWGVVPPTLPPMIIGVGAMPAGTYQVTMTYVRSDMQESGSPTPALIQVPAGGALQFSNLPVSPDPDVVVKNIYVSASNGEQLFLALTLANTSRNAAYSNDTTELDLPLEAQLLQAAPAGQLVAYYRGRMYVAAGSVLYASKPYDYERFDPRDYVDCESRITMLGPITDKEMYDSSKNSGFFIGTDRSCGVLVGGGTEEFQYIPKTSYGAVFGAADMIDGAMFEDGATTARELPIWLTTEGICVGMSDLTIKNMTRTRYTFDVGTQGAALFIPGPNRFIATSSS